MRINKILLVRFILSAWLAVSAIHIAAKANVPTPILPILEERSIGLTSAPVTLIEYASLTCDYCIRFHRQVLPSVLRNYVATGKVRFIYRDFPTSLEAVLAAAAARCRPPEDYFATLETLYKSVGDWMRTQPVETGLATVLAIPEQAQEQFRACISSENLHIAIRQQQKLAVDQGVKGTPTFVINGTIVNGMVDYERMAALLDEAGKRALKPATDARQ